MTLLAAHLLLSLTRIDPPADDPSAAPEAVTSDAPEPPGLDENALEEAVAAFERGDHDAAILWFERGYAKTGQPNILFNIARVYEEKGDLAAAVEYYQRFVGQPGVELEARKGALERIDVLRAALIEFQAHQQREAPPTDTDAPAATEGAPSDPAEPTDPRASSSREVVHRRARITAIALMGVGAATLLSGGVVGGLALADRRDLESAELTEDWEELSDRARVRGHVADGLFIAGGSLAGAGLILFLTTLPRRKGSSARSAVRWFPILTAGGTAGLGLHRRF